MQPADGLVILDICLELFYAYLHLFAVNCHEMEFEFSYNPCEGELIMSMSQVKW